MLEFLRRQSQSWLVWVAVGLISVVFIFFFGPQAGGLHKGSGATAMKVDHHAIGNNVLEAALGRLQALGHNYRDEERYEVKRQVGYDMALVEILSKEAHKTGLSISDDELHCYIVNWNRRYRLEGDFICKKFPRTYTTLYPNLDFAFYSDREGNFSSTYTQDVRRWFGESVERYERYKRKELLALRYLGLLSAGIPVSKAEAEHQWRLEHDGVNLELAIFDPSAQTPDVTDEEAQTFAEANPKAVQSYYDAHQDDYAIEHTVHLERIYLRKPGNADDVPGKKKQVDALLEKAQAPDADFAALATANSELENEAASGGDMGTRTANNLASEFLDALKDAKTGDVVLVSQQYAWSIVKLVDQTPAGTTPLDDVRLDIARTLRADEETAALADTMKRQAKSLLQRAKAESSTELQDLVKSSDAENAPDVTTTGVMGLLPSKPDLSGIDPAMRPYIKISSRQIGEIPNLGVAPKVAYEASQLTVAKPVLDHVVDIDGKMAVVRLKEKVEATEVPDDELAQTMVSIRQQRADAVVGWSAAQRRILLHSGQPLPPVLEKTLDEHDITFHEKLFHPQRRADD